jgi:hypothetical protein
VGKLRERDYFEYKGVDGRIILKWIIKKPNGRKRLDYCSSKYRQVVGCREHGTATTPSVKFRDFLDNLRNC